MSADLARIAIAEFAFKMMHNKKRTAAERAGAATVFNEFPAHTRNHVLANPPVKRRTKKKESGA